jgi:HJR/Mrr/RecB family endonuclease
MVFILGIFVVFILLCWIASECMIRNNYRDSHDSRKCSINRELKLISEAIDRLDGFQFEEFIAHIFIMNGLNATVTSKTRDGGKDVILKDKDGTMYVECKHYAEKNKISTNYIHKLVSACVIDGVKRALFITTSAYNKDSIALIKKCKVVNIDIWYKDDVLEYCKGIDRLELLEWLGYNRDEVLKYCTI